MITMRRIGMLHTRILGPRAESSGNWTKVWEMRLGVATCLLVVTASCPAQARSAVQRDVEGYAIASCLSAQDQPYLKDQGDGWASVIVQRAKGGLDIMTAVAAAVKAELAKGNMAVIRSETGPTKEKPLPVLYCGEIIDVPSVKVAINRAVKKLASSYRPH
jgi:hypothetical protein